MHRRSQFSLGRFLIWVAVIGMICGFLGPGLMSLLFRWSPGSTTPAPATSTWSGTQFEPSSSYYESGETPLE